MVSVNFLIRVTFQMLNLNLFLFKFYMSINNFLSQREILFLQKYIHNQFLEPLLLLSLFHKEIIVRGLEKPKCKNIFEISL